jgi:hypothetical protein
VSGFNLKNKITGYFAALVVATSLLTLVFFQIVSQYSTPNHGPLDIFYVWVVLGFWTLVVTFIPVALLLYFTERYVWRKLWIFSGTGAALGSLAVLWLDLQTMAECAAIGGVAGLVYWFVAGRFAGLREQAPS